MLEVWNLFILGLFILFGLLAQCGSILNQTYILISLNLNFVLFAAGKAIIFCLLSRIALLDLRLGWRVRTAFSFFCGQSFIGLFGFLQVLVLHCKHIFPFMHVPGIHSHIGLELCSQSRLFRR
jgi:hypothetical protein